MSFASSAGAALAVSALLLSMPLAGQGSLAGQSFGGNGASVDAGRDAPVADGVVDLQRLSSPITLDGLSDEAAWTSIEPLSLTMYEPTFRGASGREIQVLVGYDDDAVYVAARFYHDDPEAIRAFSLTRDRWSGDDGFGIMLDTFNDNENAVRFVGLPLGTRMDMSITGGGAGGEGGGGGGGSGGPRNLSWNAFWDFESRITDEGWFGEIRVPFSTLRFESAPDGTVVMGMMAYAYEPGSGERWTFPAIPQDFPYTQISSWQDVRFRDIEPTSPVYLMPYALTGTDRSAVLQAGNWDQATSEAYEVGGDLKLSPTPNLTLDLSVNTDFAAVEADQQQVNLTRFSLFFDEKRPFFQERAGIFQFETGAERGTLFYSRRIGLSPLGQPIPIYGGARLVGRVGTWDLGFIGMQTEGHDLTATPSENFGVLRLKRRVLNENSFIGAMGTSRTDFDGMYNVTYGVDGLFRVVGDEYLTLKWLQTFDDDGLTSPTDPTGVDAGRFVFDWTRRRLGGLSYQHALTWSGPGYAPAVGFEARSDFLRLQSDWSYQWFPDETSTWRRIWLGVQSNTWSRNPDDVANVGREMETAQVQPFFQLETKPGTTFRIESNTQFEDVISAFDLSDQVAIPAGSYWFTEGSAQFRSPRGWMVRPNVTFTAGEFYDGRRVGVRSDVSWSVDEHLELRGNWEWNRIRFENRGQEFDANLVGLTARGAFNTRLSVDLFAQYNSLNDAVTTNTRFRYNFSEGQDLWLVWNEGLNLEREVLGVPRLPLSQVRTLTVKYTHTFIL